MNAQQERAFSARADAVGRALWPGRVQIAGQEYRCSLVRTALELVAADSAGGVRQVQGIRVEIAKCHLRDCPPQEAVVKDLADGGLYLVKVTDGRAVNDTSWLLTCAQKP